jgi:hypothetical protein
MNKTSRATSFALVLTLFFGPLTRAQTPPPLELQIRLVAGINATYEVGSLQATKLAVEVTDHAGIPVPGVAVTLRLPNQGATGAFGDGTRSAIVITTERGEAGFTGIRWGAAAGLVSLRITAVKGTAHAGILAQQELIVGSRPLATSPVGRPTPAPAPPAAPSPASSRASAPPSVEAKVAITPAPVPARVNSQVTIVTQVEKPQPDPVVRAAVYPVLSAAETRAKEPPAVTISSAPPGHGSSGKTKWIVIGLVAAGAVAGIGFAMGGSKSTTAAPPTVAGTSIGTPSISIGHP